MALRDPEGSMLARLQLEELWKPNLKGEAEAAFGTLTPRYDFSWTDDVFFDPTEGRGTSLSGDRLPEGTLGQSALITHNVRLGYRPANSGIESR